MSTHQKHTSLDTTCLAYRIYPKPNGTEYFASDLKTHQQVIQLFDFCQILEAIIHKEGWMYLIQTFGFETLYELNKISGWKDCESLSEFTSDIEHEIDSP